MKSITRANISLAARVCMGLGLLASVLIALRLRRDDTIRIQEEFTREMDSRASSINEQISEDAAIMHSLKALFDASEVVKRPEFHTFASFLLTRYPSLRAVGWCPRVLARDRQDVEAQARNDGLDGFLITERLEQGTMVRAGLRNEYYPVYFIEPLENNEASLSFDLASHPTRREALHACRDTGEARITGRLTLVQETGDEWAVLFLVPVYDGMPGTPAERRESIRGVVSGVFSLSGLLMTAGAGMSPDGMIDMHLVDRLSDGTSEPLHHAGVGGIRLRPEHRYRKPLKPAGGRQWTLIATPSEAYVSEKRSNMPWMAFFLGLLITGWLSFYLAKLAQEKQRVEQQVELRTGELHAQSAALAESNVNLKREVLERKRLQEQFADVIDHEQRRLGQELHDSLGQQVAVTTMLTRSLQQRLAVEDEGLANLLDELTESSTTAQAQVRALSKGLLPVEINPGGLKDALGELTASVRGLSDVDVEFECDEDVVAGDDVAATHLYRMAQEALRNALEHGQCSRITISLVCGPRGLALTIRDDGRGFNARTSTSSGSGLSTMHHRADLIGATVTIDSREGQGTSVTCCRPRGAVTGSSESRSPTET